MKVGEVITYTSANNDWARQLIVTAVDGDNVTYQPYCEPTEPASKPTPEPRQ